MSDAHAALARAIAAALPASPRHYSPHIDHLRRAVSAARMRPQFTAPAVRDYRSTLQAALALARHTELAPLATALAAIPDLPWDYQYADQTLAERIGFAELIGPDGPMGAPLCRVGFTLLAPETHYPPHAHPAVELYWVIAGRAQWSQSQTPRMVAPGEFILHGSDEPHAMRTFAEPLLALYCWSGDLQTPPRYL